MITKKMNRFAMAFAAIAIACALFLGLFIQTSTPTHAQALASYNELYTNNWSGYVHNLPNPSLASLSTVSGKWRVPAVNCTVNGQYVNGTVGVWVGLGGLSSNVVQIGTASDCKGGRHYWPFYEVTPAGPHDLRSQGYYISPGDQMRADVTNQGYGYFVLRLFDVSRGWFFRAIEIHQDQSYTPHNVEWIVEDEGNTTNNAAPFPQFYNVVFTNCLWNNTPLGQGGGITRITLVRYVYLFGIPISLRLDTVLDVFPNLTDFSVYWNRA